MTKSLYIEEYKKVTYICKCCNLKGDSNTFALPENWEYCPQRVEGKYGDYPLIRPVYLCGRCVMVKRIIK